MSRYSDLIDTKLKRILNRSIRFINHLGWDITSVSKYYITLNWLFPCFQRTLNLGKLMYKILSNGRPSYLHDKFEFRSKSGRRFRNFTELDLKVNFARINYGSSSFSIYGALFWNSIPVTIRELPSLSIFSRSLFIHLFKEQRKLIIS